MIKFLILSILSIKTCFAYDVGMLTKYGSSSEKYSFKSDEKQIHYEANPHTDIALIFLGDRYSFGLQYSIEDEDDGDHLESGKSNFSFTFFSDTFITEFYFNEFQDYYIQNDLDELNDTRSSEVLGGNTIGFSTLFYLDGTKIQSIHGDYILKPETGMGQFYNFVIEHAEMQSSDSLIPQKYQNKFDQLKNFKKLSIDSIQTQVGLSFLKAWDYIYLNSSLMLGPSFDSQMLVGDSKESKMMISAVGEAFFGLAYYNDEFQFGLRTRRSLKKYAIRNSELDLSRIDSYVFMSLSF